MFTQLIQRYASRRAKAADEAVETLEREQVMLDAQLAECGVRVFEFEWRRRKFSVAFHGDFPCGLWEYKSFLFIFWRAETLWTAPPLEFVGAYTPEIDAIIRFARACEALHVTTEL